MLLNNQKENIDLKSRTRLAEKGTPIRDTNPPGHNNIVYEPWNCPAFRTHYCVSPCTRTNHLIFIGLVSITTYYIAIYKTQYLLAQKRI